MDEKLRYCQTCLSKDRRLQPLKRVQTLLQQVNLLEIKSMDGGMCWECISITRRFARLKVRTQHSQDILLQCRNLHSLKSSTTLSCITNNDYNYQFYYKPDPLIDTKENADVKIKEEIDSDDETGLNEDKYETDTEKQCVENYIEKSLEIEDLLKNCEEKPLIFDSSDIYVDVLNTDLTQASVKTRKSKKHTQKRLKTSKLKPGTDEGEEVREKFTTVVFSEEEMKKNREEKRNQPNFKKIPYKCDTCVLGFTRRDTFDVHMEKKHDENIGIHICPVCEIRFPTEKLVERHKRKHYVCYRCRLCKYETLELWSALSHCRVKHHGDRHESIHCGHCDTIAKTPEELSQHITKEHSVYCNECGEKFKGPSTLRSHKRRIHGVKREFICDICKKTFKTKSRLESHTVSHNAGLAHALSYCALCRVQYKNIYVYRNHLRTSASHAQQAYQCRECNKKFASKVYWKKHYNFYHLHKSQFKCDLCNKLFISDWRLKNHQQTQHGLSRTRDHHCNVCGKQFFTLSTLKGHQLTHSEQRSFMCSHCGDTFRQRPALYTHCRLLHRGGRAGGRQGTGT